LSIQPYIPASPLAKRQNKKPVRVELPQSVVDEKDYLKSELARLQEIEEKIKPLNNMVVDLTTKNRELRKKYQDTKAQHSRDLKTMSKLLRNYELLNVTMLCPHLNMEIDNERCTDSLKHNYCLRKGVGCHARSKALSI